MGYAVGGDGIFGGDVEKNITIATCIERRQGAVVRISERRSRPEER
jgi:hypothetical protein